MQDRRLYEQVLGLTDPWFVQSVELDVDEHRVDIWVDHPGDTNCCCPDCGETAPLYDHVEERVRRHLNACQFQTLIHARLPRAKCPEHGCGVSRRRGPTSAVDSHGCLSL